MTLASLPRAEAGSGSTTVPADTPTKILAAPGQRGAAEWAISTAYAQGQVVQSPSGGLVYMCVVAGTSTNVATGFPSKDVDCTDGTVTWRPVLNKERKALVICNDGTNVAYLVDYSAAAGQGKGIRLNANGGSFVLFRPADDVPQGDFYVFSAGGTSIGHFER